MCQDGKALSDLETAQLFSKHFAAAWTPPCSLSSQPETCPSSSQLAPSPRLTSILITEDDVKEALTRLSPSQSPGPDGIHPALLKAPGQQLAPLLARLFQQLLDTGCVPVPGKQAYVTPIYKGNGSPADKPESYRPISTTSVVCRTMERVLNSALHRYLNAHTLLSPAQHGFRPGRSCETALLTAVHQISDSMDKSTPCELGASAQATLEAIQRRAAYGVYCQTSPSPRFLPRDIPTTQLFRAATWSTLSHRRDVASLRLLAQVIGPGIPQVDYLRSVPRLNERTGRIDPLFARTQLHDNLCLLRGVRLWRSLPDAITSLHIKDRDEVTQLCKAAAKHL
ncbi:hypothetical protein HPB47_007941 [Ixodes persulcatus]|uniref:Uncharacterized protein n=1 Tax=Ixodes persulcatus TaxID=34615 RepID=A0AC60P639_IXOPE|nr:hypothetical protein HPB47_007941 [Ixodes persulcatus]